MRSALSRPRLLVGAAVLAVVTAGLPATAQQGAPAVVAVTTGALPVQVTGRVRPVPSYLTAGRTPYQALVLAQLDVLAAAGVDKALLTQVATRTTAHDDSAPEPNVFLSSAENLDGRGGRDVLEQRYLPAGKTRQVVQILARDGATGRLLWSRADAMAAQAFEVAFPMRVGKKGAAGVVLLRIEGDFDAPVTTLAALDGHGKQLWTSTSKGSTSSDNTSGASIGGSSGFGFHAVLYWPGVTLRPGVPDVVIIDERFYEHTANGSTTRKGSLRLSAIGGADGRVRALPGATDSPDGFVSGGLLQDQDGDGFVDVASIDAGSAHTVTVRRGRDGVVLWKRSDIATHGSAFLEEVGSLTGAVRSARHLQDVTLVTAPDPGRVGAVDTPVTTVPDPSASAHGVVTLLAGGTGTTVWSKPGDNVYALERAGAHAPAVGIVTDLSSTSATAYTASLQLNVVDVAGNPLWQKVYSLSVPRKAGTSEFAFVGGFAVPVSDLEGDGSFEGVVLLYVFTSQDNAPHFKLFVARGSDGSDISDVTSDFLGGGITRHGADRGRVTASPGGLLVTVLSGRDGSRLFSQLVPASRGVTRGFAFAVALGKTPCDDVLVQGFSGGRAVVAVLASNGLARWTVGRASADQHPGVVTVPRKAPAPHC